MLNNHKLTSPIQMLAVLFVLTFITSCTGINKNKKVSKLTPNKTKPALNKKETQLADSWVKKNLPDCKFLFSPPNSSLTANNINTCLGKFKYSYQDQGSWGKKLHEAYIDNYLAIKLSPHLMKLSISDLTNILNITLSSSRYASNPKFIKTLLDRGVPTEHILLQQIRWWSSTTGGCSVVMLILKKNAHLYVQKKYLNEPVPLDIDGKIKKAKSGAAYRRDDLFPFTYNHAHSVLCPNVIAELLKINPDLRDSVDSNKETPLHQYMDMFPNQLTLGKKLISKNNINLQDAFGRTPLHILLHYVTSPDKRVIEMTKALLKSGAKIDLRNKEGVTVRELIMKHPELKKLL